MELHAESLLEKFNLTDEVVVKTIALGRLILQFGNTNRSSFHADGVTPESDTDHTVMLGIIACAFADVFKPELNRGRIAQFALIHDLVEVYTGDVNTIAVNEKELSHKEEEERKSLERIKTEFGGVYPWIHTTIEEYESQTSAEARFVKTIDKAMPAITHALNGCASLHNQGFIKENLIGHVNEKDARLLASCAADQREAMVLRTILIKKFLENY
ncbi:MAG: hypothetical protein A3C15_03425 [Candidatus Magasanikbacteria bacterium RIFCSPHIGHO2_02_FULL_50_9b]|uniref:HD domain-containing protein n=1 Tax=Candidatus Magasanikbacteria bacterium RIFCSPHIGHO2_02_FULL_50_9b TaxID=1798682 RepID=A0A1F6M945_9BACT|nr:MAG: hypothetical protein A3C15_03425 [Candidatus Magasanikbacteria bacterium RIFCSPHIGHO2_02_FULL_50_9b]